MKESHPTLSQSLSQYMLLLHELTAAIKISKFPENESK